MSSFMDSGLVSFFNVTECGYYKGQGKDKILDSGNLDETLRDVWRWLKDRKSFSDTIPWDIEDAPGRTQVYCKSVEFNNDTGDSLFVFWKRFGDESGDFNGILANSTLGGNKGESVKLDKNVKGQEVIYGQPMYYWFIPEFDLIASIKFSKSLAATELVVSYLKWCINLRVENETKMIKESLMNHPKTGKQITVKNVSFQSRNGDYPVKFDLEAKSKILSIEQSDLERLAKKITHIVIRETISTSVKDERKVFFKLFDKITEEKIEKYNKKQVEIISEVDLTSDELKSMLEIYQEEIDKSKGWNDIGFKTDGNNGSTKWFGSFMEKTHVIMNPVDLIDNNFYEAGKLMRALNHDRKKLLSGVVSKRIKLKEA